MGAPTKTLCYDYLAALSRLFGRILPVLVRLLALKLHTKVLTSRNCGAFVNGSTLLSMFCEARIEAAEDLQNLSAIV